MASLSKVVVFDQSLYRPGGQVHKWVDGVTDKFVMHSKARAPVRTGQLRRGINGSTRQVGVRQVHGSVWSRAPHTTYVVRGTGFPVRGRAGKIYSAGGWRALGSETYAGRGRPGAGRGQYMRLTPPGRPITRVVSGQDPNNFFEAAWRATARNHTALRGWSFPLRF